MALPQQQYGVLEEALRRLRGAPSGTLTGSRPTSGASGLGGASQLDTARGNTGSMTGTSSAANRGTLVGTGAKRLSGASATPGPDGIAPQVRPPLDPRSSSGSGGTIQAGAGRLGGAPPDWRDELMAVDVGLGTGGGGVGSMVGRVTAPGTGANRTGSLQGVRPAGPGTPMGLGRAAEQNAEALSGMANPANRLNEGGGEDGSLIGASSGTPWNIGAALEQMGQAGMGRSLMGRYAPPEARGYLQAALQRARERQ